MLVLSKSWFESPHVYCSSSVALVASFTRFDFSFASIVEQEDMLLREASDAGRIVGMIWTCDYNYRREQETAKQGDSRYFRFSFCSTFNEATG